MLIKKIDPRSPTCVRWNPKLRRTELVVDGVIKASISRLKMSMARPKLLFAAEVQKAILSRAEAGRG